MWESGFKNWDTNYKFRVFLKSFEASFSNQNKSLRKTRNDWITEGSKIFSRHKRGLYTLSRRRNNPHMRAHYNKYCKTLSRAIEEAKRQHYCRLIEKADNKVKTAWKIIKHESGKLQQLEEKALVLINNKKR
jgi:hypothetical protein